MNGGVCDKSNLSGYYGEVFQYEKYGDHYNVYDKNGKLVSSFGNFADIGTNKKFKRTSYTPAEAAAAIKKGNDNKITFTFK